MLFLMSKCLRQFDCQKYFESLAKSLDKLSQWTEDSDNDQWQTFIDETLSVIKDQYNLYSIQLRKLMIDHYHDKLNSVLTLYFGDLRQKTRNPRALGSSDEPANISSHVFKISQIIHKELLNDLGLNFGILTSKFAQNIDSLISFIESAQKPELLTKSKKFSQMEMEMDKFLAKKSQIYNKSIFQTKFLEELGD